MITKRPARTAVKTEPAKGGPTRKGGKPAARAPEPRVRQDEWLPTLCYICNRGPDTAKVHVVDGKAVEIEGNADIAELSKNHGRLCAKAYGAIQKLYNPSRITNPMKRTNPKKGWDQDPCFVEITWGEAMTIFAEKLKPILENNPNGLSWTSGGPQGTSLGGTPMQVFAEAFGTHLQLGGGGSIRCTQGEHMFANMWHGAFTCEPDLNYCNYLLVFGRNPMSSGGVAENYQYANALARGMKMVVVDPRLSPTGAKGCQWIPVKPGTDAALMLGMINVILNELGAWDEPFLLERTNSPYLVGPDGYFLRDEEGKVLAWDKISKRAAAVDNSDPEQPKRLALVGEFTHKNTACKTSFQVLKDHVRQYTPEWAESVSEVCADTVRQLAKDWVKYAQIGATIELDGQVFPLRPVATKLGRGITGVMRSYQTILANHILATIVGSMEVPGGHWGGLVDPVGTFRGLIPGTDGMLRYDTTEFEWPPKSVDVTSTFLPYSKVYGHLTHLAYLNLANPEKLGTPPVEGHVRWRQNPLVTVGDPNIIEAATKNIKFFVSIAYVMDEQTWFADLALPDHTDLERWDIVPLGQSVGTKFAGMVIRQPAVEPLYNTMDVGDICSELAERLGILGRYNDMLSRRLNLDEKNRLDPAKRYTWKDTVAKACLSTSQGTKDLTWFAEKGGALRPIPPSRQYIFHTEMKARKMRYPLPYQEHILKTGQQLKKNLSGVGITWWDTSEYLPLPTYFPPVLDTEVPEEFDLYCTTYNSQVFAWANDVELPWLVELAEHEHGLPMIVMNPETAQARGISEGDQIVVESECGKTKGRASLIKGIRPDTIGIGKAFGHLITPVIKDEHWPCHEAVSPMGWRRTDWVVGCMQGQVQKVKVYSESREQVVESR